MQLTSSYPLPQPVVDQLDEICTSTTFPWYFLKDTTFLDEPSKYNNQTSFSHVLMMDYEVVSHEYPYFESALKIISEQAGQPFTDIYRARLGLLYPDGKAHHTPHVDFEFPHTVALYYVNDCDGDTHFFENSMTINKATPSKGRMIVFDGLRKHASSSPTKGVRIALNVNYKPRVS